MTSPSFNDDARILGDTDETLIGNVGDRLKVESLNSPSSVFGLTTSKKLRIEYTEPMLNISSSWVTAYSYSGSGVFKGFVFEFASDPVRVRLTIDGTDVIFSLTLNEIENMENSSSDPICGMLRKLPNSRVEFCSNPPILYETSVLIEAQKVSGPDKDLEKTMVFLTKET